VRNRYLLGAVISIIRKVENGVAQIVNVNVDGVNVYDLE